MVITGDRALAAARHMERGVVGCPHGATRAAHGRRRPLDRLRRAAGGHPVGNAFPPSSTDRRLSPTHAVAGYLADDQRTSVRIRPLWPRAVDLASAGAVRRGVGA